MAKRWQPADSANNLPLNSVFTRIAECLRTFHTKCVLDPAYTVEGIHSLYDMKFTQRRASRRHWISCDTLETYIEQNRSALRTDPLSEPAKSTPTVVGASPQQTLEVSASLGTSLNQHVPNISTLEGLDWHITSHMEPSETSLPDDNLLAISEALIDQTFTNVDRIVTLDDMMLGGFPEISMNWNFS
jgi:hypothetical protein